jgi:uncharacterized protein YjbJ (UPF0337 family)
VGIARTDASKREVSRKWGIRVQGRDGLHVYDSFEGLAVLRLGAHVLFRQFDKGTQMKPSTEDQIKGTVHEAKGTVKEKAGQVLNNPELQAEGQDEKLVGKVQQKVGQVEKLFEK